MISGAFIRLKDMITYHQINQSLGSSCDVNSADFISHSNKFHMLHNFNEMTLGMIYFIVHLEVIELCGTAFNFLMDSLWLILETIQGNF